MKPENFIIAKLADFAYTEAFHMGGSNAMLAIACIVRNRVRAGWYGGDWMTAINEARNASPYETVEPLKVDLGAGSFRAVLQDIDDIFLGMYNDDLTGKDPRDIRRKNGGLYYFDPLYSDRGLAVRPWFYEKILSDPINHPRIAQVGMLYIYS